MGFPKGKDDTFGYLISDLSFLSACVLY